MNFSFRKICEEDLSFINEVRNGYAFQYLHDSRTFTLEETLNWFKLTNPDYWMIIKDSDKIGYFRLSNYSIQNRNIYIGADIAKQYTGHGFAKTAYNLFMAMLFKKYDLNKISLEVLSTNDRAINLYKKIGFVTEGIKRQEVLKDKTYVDSIIMSMLKNEFNQIKQF